MVNLSKELIFCGLWRISKEYRVWLLGFSCALHPDILDPWHSDFFCAFSKPETDPTSTNIINFMNFQPEPDPTHKAFSSGAWAEIKNSELYI